MRTKSLAPILAAILCGPLLAQTIDAIHYRLEIELNFSNSTIQGTNTATFASLVNGLTSIDLNLLSQLQVSAVRMNGNPVPFSRPTDHLVITLDRAYNQNEQFTVQIDYGGTPPVPAGFGGLRFTTTSANRPVAWTLSEPWDARGWWPGKDELNDKSTFEIWITHPSNMTTVSNGTLQGIDPLPNNRVRTRWATSEPMAAYLASFVCTEFSRRTDTYTYLGANMPVEFYVFPESFASWNSGMNLIVPMLTAYSSVYGQYPWINEKYGIAQFTWGGGMEHQTVASQVSVSESLSAHELAHQWWGDEITCATWSDIWLNEGFATFSEAIWYENKPGGSLASYLSHMRTNKPTQTSGTVYVYNPTSVSRIFSGDYSYRKGAWVLHMLRGVLGDPTFFQALADYRTTYAGGSATTAQFRASVEQTAGRDLGWFFDEWVMNGGSPTYRYAWRSANIGGANYLLAEIDQTQTTPNVTTMPVKLRISTSAGSVDREAWDDERNDQIAVPISGSASSVAFDPDQWILTLSTPSTPGYTTPFFGVTAPEIDTATGGSVDYVMDLGTASANRPYVLVIGASGSSPGWQFSGLTIPVNRDFWTDLGFAGVNTSVFQDFLGTFDGQGMAKATLSVPPGLSSVLSGLSITASAVRIDAFDFASRPVTVQLR
ncbi:MAG: M1 family aminopeptidase [Planctomycetota bacterium]